MIAGNIIGLGFVFLQQKFSFIRLPQESYYVSHVPVYINIYQILLVNAGTFALCLLILLIPAFLLTRVSPLRAIRFD
jgi:lipoprotein-releasing system permease protein